MRPEQLLYVTIEVRFEQLRVTETCTTRGRTEDVLRTRETFSVKFKRERSFGRDGRSSSGV